MRSIYLDYNATTPLAPVAQEAMIPYLSDRFADPLSDHSQGRAVNEALEDARTRVARAIGAGAEEVFWTSGATEACNLALRGMIEPLARSGEKPHLIVSAVDHAAVQGPARFLASIGAELTVVGCDKAGRVDPQEVLDALRPDTRLVSIVHANDELGTLQPIQGIAAACREEGVLFHTDAAQSFGKTPIDVEKLGVDLLSLSAHKAYGPKGVGALYVRNGVRLEPQLHGDGHEAGLRGGMPNVSGIVGFGAAAKVAAENLDESANRSSLLRDRLEERLLSGAEEGVVYGPEEARTDDPIRLPNTLCNALPGASASDLLSAVPELSAAPCASRFGDSVSLSGSLRAIGADEDEAVGALRLSVGWYTDPEEIDRASDALLAAWEQHS